MSWQTFITVLCALLALAYLARRAVRALVTPSSSSCGNCQQGLATGIKHKPLVKIDGLQDSANQRPHGD
jgi:hypothetical protein